MCTGKTSKNIILILDPTRSKIFKNGKKVYFINLFKLT